jgi:hypothetical protein
MAVICPPSRFSRVLHRKGLSLLFDFVFGLESGIPWCCVLEYCYRSHLLRQHDLSARLTGTEVFEMCPWLNFVPCWRHRRFLVDDFFYPMGLLSYAVWIPGRDA